MIRPPRLLLWALVWLWGAAGLAGCASDRPRALVPFSGEIGEARRLSLLVVSTRAPSDQPGRVFSGRRAEQTSLGVLDVSIPPTHVPGHIEWPRDVDHPDPAREFATLAYAPSDPVRAMEWFRLHNVDGEVVIFVHGFNTPFAGAAYRLAQLTHDTRLKAAPVLFTWPSQGRLYDYVYDRESANYSRDALERLLRMAQGSPDVRHVTLLAHSMGAWVTMEALRQYAIRDGRAPAKLDNVILAAPDLDADVFLKQFETLGAERPRFTILISRDDRALTASKLLAGGVMRLGAVDLGREPYRSALAKGDGVTILDLTRMKAGDRMNHGKFASSPEVVRLLGERLLQGQRLTGGRAPAPGAVVLELTASVAQTLNDGLAPTKP